MSDDAPESEFFKSRRWQPPLNWNAYDDPPRDDGAPPVGEPVDATASRFKLEDWNDIDFDPNTEWRVEDVVPMRGLGLIYGKPGSLKSFVAKHLALHVLLGLPWAGKRVEKGKVVYVAAEGAPGMRKRIAAYKAKYKIPRGDFALVSVAPNLGTADGDLSALIAAVESSGVKPAVITIDTVSKSIGTAEENGTGMAAFVCNAEKLWQHFDCFVLGVHHVGLGEDAQKRPRGWSGLGGALDVQILCERAGDEKRTTLTVQKLKDEEDGVCFEARLSRVVVGHDKRGKEASTLIVDEVVEIEAAPQPEPGKRPDASTILRHELLSAYDRLADAVPASNGFNGKSVRKVSVDAIRDELRDRGFLELNDAQEITSTARSRLSRAKTELLSKTVIIERKGLIWRPN
jgi:hypothetical protein